MYVREFQQTFLGVDILARSAIHCLVKKFKTTGLVFNKKVKRRCHILTEEKLDVIGARLERLPR
jgi:hypothetical protein